jgi:hypothetical protein
MSSAVVSSAVASSDARAVVTNTSISYEIIEFTRTWIMKSIVDPLSKKMLLNAAIDPFACLGMISDLINEERTQQMQMQMQDQEQFQGQYEFQQMQNDVTIVSSLKEPVLAASNTIAPLDIKSLKKDESSNEEKSSSNSSRKEEDSSNNENKSSSWAAVASVVTTVPQPAPSPSGSSSLSSIKSAKSVTSAASSSNSGNSNTYVNNFVDKVIDDEVRQGTILGFNKDSNTGFYEIDSINMFFKSVRLNTDLTYETLILYLAIINMPNEYREREIDGKLIGGIYYSNTELFRTKVLPAYSENKIKVHDFDEDHEFYPCIKEYIDRIIVKENGFYLKKKKARLFITSKFLSLLKDHLIYE